VTGEVAGAADSTCEAVRASVGSGVPLLFPFPLLLPFPFPLLFPLALPLPFPSSSSVTTGTNVLGSGVTGEVAGAADSTGEAVRASVGSGVQHATSKFRLAMLLDPAMTWQFKGKVAPPLADP
jgi:hypothetical protein